jgi:hypothetical protein
MGNQPPKERRNTKESTPPKLRKALNTEGPEATKRIRAYSEAQNV